ncbi:MAG: class I SAM-dependent methyltransferase, partial [Promethearchaeota archaeon]
MSSYYSKTLNAEKLELCYEIAPQRVQQYLQEEINYVLERVSATDIVLDLGCGYGRIIPQLKQ